ncbi:FecCD family ABC transporter permease [Tranquillimonas alkanivorans]|uniref:Iron complex transport system permease protein n=1 Tax=Tranquillimonas alkanivorans TaxID=441119 RepID=A0A1I5WU13_9RHOB|nr:iron ABC transporter permease [Tranquillimonas alkanivorans]SFQ22997.1 iron complex transport system permease protein [Tranquillimonas alkanivorans]
MSIPLRLSALALALAVLFLAGVGVGSSFIPPERVIAALFGAGERTDGIIVWNLRLPRVLLAILAGVALALAGALLQRATRNPLASPSVLGVVDGAAVGVLVFLFAFSDSANLLQVSVLWQPAFAAAGAGVFALAVAGLVWRDRGDPMRLILYGVALAALANAAVVLMLIVGPVYRSSQALIWLAGSVHQAEWRDVAIVSAAVAPALPLLALMARPLDQMRLDPLSAFATGLRVELTRAAALLLSVYLAAAAVSVAGGIGFVGLIAPHAARLLLGTAAGAQMLGAALLGGAIVSGADLLVRAAFQPLEVPTGAVTALIGAPYFLFLLTRVGRTHA